MKKFSVVIAENDELTRKNIQQRLKQHEYFEPIALAFTADEVKEICMSFQADVLFINDDLTQDSELRNVIEQLPPYTHVVYISKDRTKAAKAFEYDVVDYLMPPINTMRFQKCLTKLMKYLEGTTESPMQQVQSMIQQLQLGTHQKEPVIVKDAGRIRIIDSEDILWIGGAGNYVELHLVNEERPILHRETLASMQTKLINQGFVRIHRSALVRKQSISELKPTENGDYLVTLKNGALLNLSRRYKQSMAGILN